MLQTNGAEEKNEQGAIWSTILYTYNNNTWYNNLLFV